MGMIHGISEVGGGPRVELRPRVASARPHFHATKRGQAADVGETSFHLCLKCREAPRTVACLTIIVREGFREEVSRKDTILSHSASLFYGPIEKRHAPRKPESHEMVVQVVCRTLPHTRNCSRGRSSRPVVHRMLLIEQRSLPRTSVGGWGRRVLDLFVTPVRLEFRLCCVKRPCVR